MPFLPFDEVALDREAGPLRLNNAQGLQPCPPLLLHEISVVVDIKVWDAGRDLVLLINPHDLQRAAP